MAIIYACIFMYRTKHTLNDPKTNRKSEREDLTIFVYLLIKVLCTLTYIYGYFRTTATV